jgi:homoserine dehydrogenase
MEIDKDFAGSLFMPKKRFHDLVYSNLIKFIREKNDNIKKETIIFCFFLFHIGCQFFWNSLYCLHTENICLSAIDKNVFCPLFSSSGRENMVRQAVKVGLLGLGTVGQGVVRIISDHQQDLYKETGLHVEIDKVLVQDLHKKRETEVNPDQITLHPEEVIENPEIDVVIEVMGGIEPAKEYILTALKRKKHVVTANKDLMALYGAEILRVAQEKQCDVYYEASVAGGIPILRVLMDSFSSDRIHKIMGVVNGTTNYILSKMSQNKANFENTLSEAQKLGYAEADPSSDVNGWDAAYKMSILSTLGFHIAVHPDEVDVRGITQVTMEDIELGKDLGYELKLLGLAKRDDEKVEVSVQPTFLSRKHPLASIDGVNNAILIEGEAVGETMFYGPGAGSLPTATSVVSDLVTIIRNMKLGVNGQRMVAPYETKRLKTDREKGSKYFLRLVVADERGVLARLTQLFAENHISMEQVIQKPYNGGYRAEIILVTHEAVKADLNRVLASIHQQDGISELKSCYPVLER